MPTHAGALSCRHWTTVELPLTARCGPDACQRLKSTADDYLLIPAITAFFLANRRFLTGAAICQLCTYVDTLLQQLFRMTRRPRSLRT
jgi:hypothetical protein